MAIDWERVIVESDDNGVVVSAGQVSLLIGADADSVSWGNITGDITQQPDLMQIVDGYVSADSPTFTGIPRSVTPPEGNNSTRIATTAYVQGEMANVRRDVSGKVNEAPVNNHIWGRKDENWAQLGEMATVDEPAHGISSSEPQRFVRTKEPDGDMVWEEVGTMAMLDAPDSLTPNITYGLYNGEMVNIDPTPNGSATKKYWLRTNEVIKEGEHTGDRDPKWEQAGTMAIVDEPPISKSNTVDIYARVNGSDGNKEWVLLGAMARVDEPPNPESPYQSSPELYVRTSYWTDKGIGHDWVKYDPQTPSSGPTIDDKGYARTRYVRGYERRENNNVIGFWEKLDEPPVNNTSNTKYYVRTSYRDSNNYKFDYGWEELGTMINSLTPPVNTSANVKKRWVMINEGKDGVAVDNPEWEELDEPPWSSASESNPDCYVRTAYMVGTPPDHKYVYGWKKVNL